MIALQLDQHHDSPRGVLPIKLDPLTEVLKSDYTQIKSIMQIKLHKNFIRSNERQKFLPFEQILSM